MTPPESYTKKTPAYLKSRIFCEICQGATRGRGKICEWCSLLSAARKHRNRVSARDAKIEELESRNKLKIEKLELKARERQQKLELALKARCTAKPESPPKPRRIASEGTAQGKLIREMKTRPKIGVYDYPDFYAPPSPDQEVGADCTYRFIPLSRGLYAIVDAKFYAYLSQWKWHARGTDKQGFYACRGEKLPNGKHLTVLMHREILGLRRGDGLVGDHALHNTLDNRLFVDGRENLRIATPQQNVLNRRGFVGECGYRGVHRYKGSYAAYMTINGKFTRLGVKETATEAFFELWVPAAKANHGKFAYLGSDFLQAFYHDETGATFQS